MKSEHVKQLRKNMTYAERFLWRHLRSKQFQGLKFRRQEPIGDYIVDFVCFEKYLILEIDGGQHADDKQKDIERDKWFESGGSKHCVSGITKF